MAKKKPTMKTETPVRSGKAINVWINSELHAALEAFLKAQRVRPTTTSVVETALEDFLKSEGYWPPQTSD